MFDEIGRELKTAAERNEVPRGDLDQVLAGARKDRIIRRSVGLSLAVIVVVFFVTLSPWKDLGHRAELPVVGGEDQSGVVELIPEQQQAEIFAFRAAAATGLMDPFAERVFVFTYTDDTTRTGDAWKVGFTVSNCAPKDGGFACRHPDGTSSSATGEANAFLIVQLADETWSVTGAEGNVLDSERTAVTGYALSREAEASRWEFPSVDVYPSEKFSMVMAFALWVGPYPTQAPPSRCGIVAVDDAGEVVFRDAWVDEAPNRPFSRAGWVRSMSVDGSAVEATIDCVQQESGEPRSDWRMAGYEPIVTGGLIFDDLEMMTFTGPDETPAVAIRGSVDFVDGFPGTTTCDWTVSGEDGQKVGSATKRSTFSGASEGLLVDRIDVSGDPQLVSVNCAKGDPVDRSGRMKITVKKITTLTRSYDSHDPDYQVGFRYRWIGEGIPPPHMCEVRLIDSVGSVIATIERGFTSMVPGPRSSHFSVLGEELEAEPRSAEIDCYPIK